MKWLRTAVLVFALLTVLSVTVTAAEKKTETEKQESDRLAEQVRASGADTLPQKLPASAQELLNELMPDPLDPESYTGFRLSDGARMLRRLLTEQRSAPVQAVLSVTTVVVLSAMLGGIENAAAVPSVRQTYHTVSVLAGCGMLLVPFTALLRTVSEAVESVTVFMYSFIPVYGAVLAVSGSAAAAVSYQTTLLAAAECFAHLIRAAVLPVLSVSLALGCAGSVTEEFPLDAVSRTFHKIILWVLGLLATVFSGVLSFQQMVAASGDTLGGRAMRFSIASLVPVVGGALSEAYSTVVGCAGLLRSTVGCFGVVAAVLILLPPLVSCLCWDLCLLIGGSAAGLFRLTALEKLCSAVASAVRVLIAVLAVFALLMIVTTSVIVFTAAR